MHKVRYQMCGPVRHDFSPNTQKYNENSGLPLKETPPPIAPVPGKEREWRLLLMLYKPGEAKTTLQFLWSCGALPHGRVFTLYTEDYWHVDLSCVGTTTRQQWRNRNSGPTQRLWWIFVSGEKSIDTANCQEGSNITGLCPKQRQGIPGSRTRIYLWVGWVERVHLTQHACGALLGQPAAVAGVKSAPQKV